MSGRQAHHTPEFCAARLRELATGLGVIPGVKKAHDALNVCAEVMDDLDRRLKAFTQPSPQPIKGEPDFDRVGRDLYDYINCGALYARDVGAVLRIRLRNPVPEDVAAMIAGLRRTDILLCLKAATELERRNQADEVKTLGDELPKEMARVRDKVMPAYMAIGAAGTFALAVMRADLDRAARAMVEGDVVAMLSAYESLKGFNT